MILYACCTEGIDQSESGNSESGGCKCPLPSPNNCSLALPKQLLPCPPQTIVPLPSSNETLIQLDPYSTTSMFKGITANYKYILITLDKIHNKIKKVQLSMQICKY